MILNSPNRSAVSPESLFRAKMPDNRIVFICIADFKHDPTFIEKCGDWEVTKEHISQKELDSFTKQIKL